MTSSTFTERWSRLEPWLRANFTFPGTWNDKVAWHYDRELARFEESDIAFVFRKLANDSHLLPPLGKVRRALEQRSVEAREDSRRTFQARWQQCCRIYGPRMTEAFLDPHGDRSDWRPSSPTADPDFKGVRERLTQLGALEEAS